MKLISLVVPCYNEEEVLPHFYEAFMQFAPTMAEKANFELILINDGSRDKTLEIIRELAKKDERVKYVSFSRNFGKEAGMLAGLEKSTGDLISIVDADLQDPLEMLVDMYEGIVQEGYDCVGARRSTRDGEPKLRSLFSDAFYYFINKVSDVPIVNGARDFRLMTRQMVDSIISMREYNRFSKGIFSFVGFKTKWLAYKNVERAAGATSWSFWSLFKYSMEGILGFSTALLHLSSLMGLFFCLCSFSFMAYIVIRTLMYGSDLQGYPSLVCLITFLGGIQLLSVGVLGQYIAKMYMEGKKRPIYIVKEEN